MDPDGWTSDDERMEALERQVLELQVSQTEIVAVNKYFEDALIQQNKTQDLVINMIDVLVRRIQNLEGL